MKNKIKLIEICFYTKVETAAKSKGYSPNVCYRNGETIISEEYM